MTAWLLTWLWQGVALAMSLAITFRLLPRVNAATRYLIWWAAFAALIVLGWQLLPSAPVTGALAAASSIALPSGPRVALEVPVLPSWALSIIAMLWLCVALFRMLRIVPGLHALYGLKDECRSFPAGVEAQLALWREGRGRAARLVLCDGLPGAAVLGLHDPCIALPSSLVAELSAADLDQVILHEYGHVQRRDDWMRLVQKLLEAALWVHPAVYLIGRALDLEREVACDDWVIARTGSPKNYARCLSRVAERRSVGPSPAFAPALFGSRHDLVRRVDRLLDSGRNTRQYPSVTIASFGALTIAACVVKLSASPLLTDALPLLLPHVTSPPASSIVHRRSSSVVVDRRPSVVHPTSKIDAPRSATVDRNLTTDDGRSTMDDGRWTIDEEASPMVYPTRVFAGVYARAEEAQPPESRIQAPFVNAGVGIAEAAQKAGVGLANSFTRAGTSIARRF